MIINRYNRYLKNQLTKPHLDFKDLCFIYKDMILKNSLFQEVIVADALSRSALPDTSPQLTDAELESHNHLIKECLPVSERKLKEIQDETMKDSVLSKVCFYINNGWSTTRSQVITETKPFF